MYQNVYLQKGKDLVHLWDDKLGYQTFPYKTFNYAYAPAERGQSTALDGTKVTKSMSLKRMIRHITKRMYQKQHVS
jgi:hypothetical protein